jgi:hypothetical protein
MGATVRNAARTLVFSHGRILETGTFDEPKQHKLRTARCGLWPVHRRRFSEVVRSRGNAPITYNYLYLLHI